MSLSEDLLAADQRHVWHPYATAGEGALAAVRDGSGIHLQLTDGRKVIDAMSSWWSVVHGYRHPVLDEAVRSQLGRMAHVMFGGLTHEPAITLATRLATMTGLERVFFSDSGSVSVEVALKMALQYQRGVGHPERSRFVTIRGGYHGDTFGAMSVCDPDGGMHSMFTGVLPQHTFLPRPPAGFDTPIDEWVAECEPVLDRLSDVAAVIIEPVLQGAGGMHIYPPAAVRWLAEQARDRGWLLVLDEIATGFHRIGLRQAFAFQRAQVKPDILCLGKALTAGYLTLAATLCSQDVADGISASESGVLMHGPTYMANPLACAVANASLDLLDAYDPTVTWEGAESRLREGLAPALEVPGVRDVRVIGSVGVIQLEQPVDVQAATSAAMDAGVWLRPFRDLIYAMPPYVCETADLEQIADGMVAAAKANHR